MCFLLIQKVYFEADLAIWILLSFPMRINISHAYLNSACSLTLYWLMTSALSLVSKYVPRNAAQIFKLCRSSFRLYVNTK